MRVFISNLGCKLNQAEVEHLGRQLTLAGCLVADSLDDADLHIVNTCNVTHLAARDSRKLARRGHRLDPKIRTVLTGCYVTGQPEEAAQLAGVDLIVPNRAKDSLVERIAERFPELLPDVGSSDPDPAPCSPLEFGNSRALVKIEDGCNMRCSFCVIPMMRGPQASRPLDDVLREVTTLSTAGRQEIVLTGVQISSYRWQGKGLFELVGSILEETPVARLRLTSIAPWQFDRRLLDLFSSGRLCRHVHLSLQSGSTRTLQRMRRPYTSSEFADLVDTLRQWIPGIAITTDVIVGFPGESQEEFDESLEFCRQMAFSRLHAFPFSSRPGTEAAAMPQQVEHGEKRLRMQRMLRVARKARIRFEQAHLDSVAEVLWEYHREGSWYGLTDNYLRVMADSSDDLCHRITPVRLTSAGEGSMTGKLCSAANL